MFVLFLLATSAPAVDWDTLYGDAGWDRVSTPTNVDAGRINLDHKMIGKQRCLRGTATTDVPPQTLYNVVVDVPGAQDFSSETLLATRVLRSDGDTMDFYQHVSVPIWTLASNRFWVLRGRKAHAGKKKIFKWERFPWRKAYPKLADEIAEQHAHSIEPNPNWGSWTFTPGERGTQAVYYVCTDGGGTVPDWIKQAAANTSLPNVMGDIMREGRRRIRARAKR